jgi:steroid delta-isomerase-like uncharacterized protein
MTPEENKDIVRRYVEGMWDKRDFATIDEYVSPEFDQHAATVQQGREGLRNFFRMMFGALPDVKFTLESIIAEDDKVATRWTIRGTHQGPLLGIPATGKPVTTTGMSLLQLRDGKIIANWNEVDLLAALRQMGLTPKP